MGRLGIIAGVVTLAAAVGCGEGGGKGHPGHAGAGGAAGGCVPGTGGSGGSPGSCEGLSLASTFVSAPAAEGQLYTRCQTIGLDNDWRVTLSPDGARIAAQTSSGTVRLIDTRSWREIAQLASPLGRIDAVTFSADGLTLATASSEMAGVTLWSAADGTLTRGLAGGFPAPMIGHFDADLTFSADGRRLATALESVVDLTIGASTLWSLNGLTANFILVVNPESLLVGPANIGQSFHDIRFLPDDSRVYVRREYRTGNSIPHNHVSLVDPSTGGSTVLLDVFVTLSSAAISNDRRFVAIANQNLAVPPIGLHIYRTDTGVAVVSNETAASNPSSPDRLLGFSPDGARLYVRNADGNTMMVFTTADLQLVRSFPLPASDLFLGISPFDAVVTSNASQTTWWDTRTGAVRRVAAYPLTEITWSADGQFGAGTNGGRDALFHFWREPDGTQHCAPPPRLGSTPPLASFGGASSADGSVVTVQEFVVHTHANDWFTMHVRDASGNELRQFSPAGLERGVAVSADGSRLYTNEGTAVAVWCK